MKIKKQYIIAHRGASGLVEHENTIEAFEKAIEVGADYIEPPTWPISASTATSF